MIRCWAVGLFGGDAKNNFVQRLCTGRRPRLPDLNLFFVSLDPLDHPTYPGIHMTKQAMPE